MLTRGNEAICFHYPFFLIEMIRILLVLFTLITLFLGFRIANILVNDFDRLTDFGYGYLVAQVILFCIFFFASLWTGRRILKQSRAGEHTRSA